MKKILLDTNVVLDLLLKREPFCKDAKEIFIQAENKQIQAFLCATTITTIYYLVSKAFSKRKVDKLVQNLLLLFDVAKVDKDVLNKALQNSGVDFEDSVIYTSAMQESIELIITRDIKGFKNSKVKIYTPKEFLL